LEVTDGANEFGFHPSLPADYRLQYFETVSLLSLCLKANLRSAPKLIERWHFFEHFFQHHCAKTYLITVMV
jgi:hypothetical protein